MAAAPQTEAGVLVVVAVGATESLTSLLSPLVGAGAAAGKVRDKPEGCPAGLMGLASFPLGSVPAGCR